MKAVNAVTQYLLKKMKAVETGNKKIMLVDIYDQTKEAGAGLAAAPEEVEEAAMKSAVLAVTMNLALNLRELLLAAAKAGRVICEVADPDMVREAGGEVHDPDDLREMAKEAGSSIGMLVTTLHEMLPAVQQDIDVEHIAECLIAEGRKVREAEKAKKAETAVQAKPVSGMVVPFGKRIEPSSN